MEETKIAWGWDIEGLEEMMASYNLLGYNATGSLTVYPETTVAPAEPNADGSPRWINPSGKIPRFYQTMVKPAPSYS